MKCMFIVVCAVWIIKLIKVNECVQKKIYWTLISGQSYHCQAGGGLLQDKDVLFSVAWHCLSIKMKMCQNRTQLKPEWILFKGQKHLLEDVSLDSGHCANLCTGPWTHSVSDFVPRWPTAGSYLWRVSCLMQTGPLLCPFSASVTLHTLLPPVELSNTVLDSRLQGCWSRHFILHWQSQPLKVWKKKRRVLSRFQCRTLCSCCRIEHEWERHGITTTPLILIISSWPDRSK